MVTYLTLFLIIHITSGVIAMLSGLAAMMFQKGGPQHALSGKWFFISMLVMASTATPLAVVRPERLSAVVSVLTLYLVVTSWSAATRRNGRAGWLEWAGVPVVLGCMAANIWFGQVANANANGALDGQPAMAYFVFAGLAGLAATLDIAMLSRGQLSQKQRTARHLWRMCTAYLLAVTSLFLGQQDDVFPLMIGSPVLVIPSLATLAFMVFWLVKLRIKPVHRLIWTSNPACATDRHTANRKIGESG